jgi:hypothetical protein
MHQCHKAWIGEAGSWGILPDLQRPGRGKVCFHPLSLNRFILIFTALTYLIGMSTFAQFHVGLILQ